MIAIFDYGAGNLRSVENTLAAIGAEYEIVNDATGLERAEKIILPGVGHFGQLLRSLDSLKVRATFRERIAAGVPYLGICLGMQALFESSEEAPDLQGLAVYPGRVVRFPADLHDPASGERLKIPHMGWNQVRQVSAHPLWRDIPEQSRFYFVHSYYAVPDDPACVTGRTEYGLEFTAVIARENLFAAQFHPEKSQHAGLQLLANFVAWNGEQ